MCCGQTLSSRPSCALHACPCELAAIWRFDAASRAVPCPCNWPAQVSICAPCSSYYGLLARMLPSCAPQMLTQPHCLCVLSDAAKAGPVPLWSSLLQRQPTQDTILCHLHVLDPFCKPFHAAVAPNKKPPRGTSGIQLRAVYNCFTIVSTKHFPDLIEGTYLHMLFRRRQTRNRSPQYLPLSRNAGKPTLQTYYPGFGGASAVR